MSDLNENSFFVRKDYSKRSLFKDQYNLVLKLKKDNIKKPESIKEELPIATEDEEWYYYVDHAIRKVRDELEKGIIPKKGTVAWY